MLFCSITFGFQGFYFSFLYAKTIIKERECYMHQRVKMFLKIVQKKIKSGYDILAVLTKSCSILKHECPCLWLPAFLTCLHRTDAIIRIVSPQHLDLLQHPVTSGPWPHHPAHKHTSMESYPVWTAVFIIIDL